MKEEYNNLKSLIEKNHKIKLTNLELNDDNLILSSSKEDLLFDGYSEYLITISFTE